MISAILTTLGICIAIVLIIVGGLYGIVKLVLTLVGAAGGTIKNAFDKVRR